MGMIVMSHPLMTLVTSLENKGGTWLAQCICLSHKLLDTIPHRSQPSYVIGMCRPECCLFYYNCCHCSRGLMPIPLCQFKQNLLLHNNFINILLWRTYFLKETKIKMTRIMIRDRCISKSVHLLAMLSSCVG